MSTLLESYRILGVKVGAEMAEVTSTYKRLCRKYHPDISDAPDAEELMKQINIAYTVLRDKFKREESYNSRFVNTRPTRKSQYQNQNKQNTTESTPRQATGNNTTQSNNHSNTQGFNQHSAANARNNYYEEQKKREAETKRRKVEEEKRRQVEQVRQAAQAAAAAAAAAALSREAEAKAREVLQDYFVALNGYEYEKAYSLLSNYDKRNITLEAFVKWRESVTRLFPMREFRISGNSSIAVITWDKEKSFNARKFRIMVIEDDFADNKKLSGDVDKLVINEKEKWGVFLGYKEVNELTRSFDKRFESKKKDEIEKRWEDYIAGYHPEYDMLNLEGLKKHVSRELYRQRRYGGSLTFVAISIKRVSAGNAGEAELLRSAAKTINTSLREIDVPAYAEDGIFAIMYVELSKKNAQVVIQRLIDTIKRNAGPQLAKGADISFEFGSWSGQSFADKDTLNGILVKYGKNI